MKNILLSLAIAFCTLPIFAQKRAPANPDYYKYIKDIEKGLISESGDGFVLNYAPMLSSTPEYLNGYTINRKKSSVFDFLPSYYDLSKRKNAAGTRNLMSAIRNQGGGNYGGNCWCFASVGAIESNWHIRQSVDTFKVFVSDKKLLTNVAPGGIDMSEQNLATLHKFKWGYGQGGNANMAMAYFTRLQGPIFEYQDPYNVNVRKSKPNIQPMVFVPETRWTSSNDVRGLKQTILNHGGVTAEMYYSESNRSTNKYQYKGNDRPNHMLMLVGWNDTLEMQDGTKGAWVARNSWGTNWAENGYVNIAYNDSRVSNSRITYYPTRWDAINSSTTNPTVTALYYDTLGLLSFYGFDKPEAYVLVKYNLKQQPTKTTIKYTTKSDTVRIDTFKIDGKNAYKFIINTDTTTIDTFIIKPDKLLPQQLKAIGTFIISPGEEIDIDLFRFKNGNTLSGLITSKKNIKNDLQGFYTFDMPVTIPDSSFYVRIKYKSPGWNYPIPCEEAVDVTFADPHIEKAGKQWISPDGSNWQDIGSDVPNKKFDLNIKAYLSYDTLQPIIAFNTNKTEVCPGSELMFENLSKIKGNVQYNWDFGDVFDNNADRYKTGTGPFTIKISNNASLYSGIRTATLTAKISDSIPVYASNTIATIISNTSISDINTTVTKDFFYQNTIYLSSIVETNSGKLDRSINSTIVNYSVDKWKQRDSVIKTQINYRIVEGVDVKLFATKTPVIKGDTIQLLAVAQADSFQWQAGYDNDTLKSYFNPNKNTAWFSASDTGVYKYNMLAYQLGVLGNTNLPGCPGVAELSFKVVAPPANDNPCNTIALNYGKNGSFTNVDATFSAREVLPVEGDSSGISTCNTPLKWCSEGGLQNSVWFSFTPTYTGFHSFDTRGFDTQIAIYKSDTCINMNISDLVAANDDYHNTPTDSFAAAIDTVTLTKGVKYLIQVDGSAGGANGKFYITIGKEFFLTYHPEEQKDIKIIPNPNKSSFNVNLSESEANKATIEIFDLNGRLMKAYKVERDAADYWVKHLDTNLPQGIYFIRISDIGGSKTSKLMIQN